MIRRGINVRIVGKKYHIGKGVRRYRRFKNQHHHRVGAFRRRIRRGR